ncbi:ATP-binding protein [Rhizobium ruizarguesonis]|jgi:energy-coupling factor transporter ATP-binding protein EcfA2|uniref:AAA family ATPase n=1 Tax=Rhizobium ruizarguesonis TaxID=2081791 RepID=UPI001031D18D|nr:AAA family ATPase [Rhizobium ruizarguesonis]TAZ83330.1 ATP-binding protein [Rhizobium ruizarguesonis]
MDFYVAPEDKKNDPEARATLVLQQDGWDDHGFKTQYHVFYFGAEFQSFVGNVKILQVGQRKTSHSILPVGNRTALGEDFCSLGQSLDYYERLASLPESVRRDILTTLRDSLLNPALLQNFSSEEGWRTSVTRDLDIHFIPLATVLLERNYSEMVDLDVQLKFTATGWQNSLDLDFSGPNRPAGAPPIPPIFPPAPGMRFPSLLPDRVAVITGRNGSGKSTLLFRLARILHASQRDRLSKELRKLGSIEPPGIGFSRIITIAYSAFDTFQVPGVGDVETRQIIKDIQTGTGRYVFAGLRDIARELQERPADQPTPSAQVDGEQTQFELDRQEVTYLKSTGQLAEEYVVGINRIFDANRAPVLLRVLRVLFADASFADLADRPMEFLQRDLKKTFMMMSTGHKIVLHATITLIANALPKSVVLIDEPESHLHPPLLAAFMHGIRDVLLTYDSFAVIATHSPVVAQETLRRHVSVVSRMGGEPNIHPARIETYGESIGAITNEVFGLHANATDYHATLQGMVAAGYNLEQIEGFFDDGLSLQARAYVMSLLATPRG